jgi:TRAP-type C4-dicarboxylate transport system substrate-binding protein
LLDQLSDSGFKGLAYYDSGARNFYTADREVRTPEDLQGLQIRVQQSAINTALMEAFGAAATPMDFGEVYSALQTGVVDGAENNWPSYLSTSHYEVAPNFTLDEHTRIPEVLIMNQGAWDQLNDEDKQIIQDAATESVDFQREEWDQAEQQAQDELAGEGVNVIPVEDKEPWREAVQPVIESFRDEYGDVLDQIEAAKP